MISKSPIIPQRIRRITGSFSWLDHRLLHHGFVQRMQPNEIVVYFFLVLVGDKNGISYYSYDRMCDLLKLTVEQLVAARDRLIDLSLIAFDNGRYQVLSLNSHYPPLFLPGRPVKQTVERSGQFVSIKQLLNEATPR